MTQATISLADARMPKRPREPRPVWVKCRIGRLLFAPGEHRNGMDLVVVDTLAQLLEALAAWAGAHKVDRLDGDVEACCCYDFEAPGPVHGFLIFAREKLTRAHVVHECVHAGMIFVQTQVGHSSAVLAMSEDEREEYCDEACAQTVEKLFEQAEAILWPEGKAT